MDPNTNQILRDILEKTEDSNKLLQDAALFMGAGVSYFYWTLIIGGSSEYITT